MKARKYCIESKKRRWLFNDTNETISGDYITPEGLVGRHPNNDYDIIGQIILKEDVSKGTTRKVEDIHGNELEVHPVGASKGKSYKTIGYIQCSDHEYVMINQKSSRKYLWLLLALLALLLALGGFWFFGNKKGGPALDPNASDYKSELKRPANIDSSQILIPGYKEWSIKKGEDTINSVLFNPEDNPCYFKYTITDKTTGDTIYESGLVAPGKGIQPIKLTKKYKDAGSYALALTYETIDFEDTDIHYNGSTIDVTLNVKE